jgi:hypothetical protein
LLLGGEKLVMTEDIKLHMDKETKKNTTLRHAVLAGFFLVFGLLQLFVGLFQYTFVSSINWMILSVFICAIIIPLTVMGIRNRAEQTKTSVVIAICLPLFALFYILTKAIATDIHGFGLILLSYVSVICALLLLFFLVRKRCLIIVFSVLHGVILLPMFLFSLLILFGTVFMGDFGRIETTGAETSPNAVYLAEIVSDDRGALGGRTEINITELNRDINLFIGELQRNSIRIYSGSWWEYKYMSLRWEGDETLYVYARDGVMQFLKQGGNWVRN